MKKQALVQKNIGNLVRLLIVILNIVLFIYSQIRQIDLFISSIIILNSFSISVCYFFDHFSENNDDSFDEKLTKERILIKLKGIYKQTKNWFVIWFPLLFYLFETRSRSFEIVECIFYVIAVLHVNLNLNLLSILIKELFRFVHIIYIILIGFAFQIYISFYSGSFESTIQYLIGLTLISYACVAFLIFKNHKENSISLF